MAQRREPGRQQRAFQDLLDPEYQTFLDEDQTKGPRAHLSKRQWKKNKAKVKGEARGFKLKETGSAGCAEPTDTEKLLELFGDSLDTGLLNDVYVSNGRSLARTIDALFAMGNPQPQQIPMEAEQPVAGPSTAAADIAETSTAMDEGSKGIDGSTIWTTLPEDVKLDIWRRLRLKEMAQAARTCKDFAGRVRSLRAGMHSLTIPAGLTFSAIKGMVAAHHKVYHVSLAKCTPHIRHSLDFIRYLGAVAAGQAERRSGVAITSLDLKGCQAMGDSDVASLLDMFGSLKELHLEGCSRLSNAAVRSLAQYKRSDESEEQQVQLMAQRTVECIDKTERHIAISEATQGITEQDARQNSLQRAILKEGIQQLKDAVAQLPEPPKGKGLVALTLAACGLITQHGISPIFHGTAAMKSLEMLDVSACPHINERCMASFAKGQSVLRTLKVNNIYGLHRVSLLLPNGHPLQDIHFAGCKNMQHFTLSATKAVSVNVSGCDRLTSVMVHTPLLEKLKAPSCPQLADLVGASPMPMLKDINIYGCNHLETPALMTLLDSARNVEELHATGCLQLTSLVLQDQLRLRRLDLSGCAALTRVVVASPMLQILKARHCTRLTGITLASIQLQEVMLSNCDNLINIQLPGVENSALHGGVQRAPLAGPLDYNVDGCGALPPLMVAKLKALA